MVTEDGFLDLGGMTNSLIDRLIPLLDDELRNVSKSEFNNSNFYSIKNVKDIECSIESSRAYILFVFDLEDFNNKKISQTNYLIEVNNLENAFFLLTPNDEKEINIYNDEMRMFWKKKDKISGLPRFLNDTFAYSEIAEYFKALDFDKSRRDKEMKFLLIYTLIRNINNDSKIISKITDGLIVGKKESF